MGERTERGVLQHLVETCHDAERGFLAAAERAQSPSLRQLFRDMAADHHRFAEDLLPHLQRMGGADIATGTLAGSVHRGWLTLRGQIARNHDRALLAEAGRGEGFALAAFDHAVEGLLPPAARELIEAQDAAVRHAYLRLARFAPAAGNFPTP
jgi:uncharacterized protein (TIGR02284 family)